MATIVNEEKLALEILKLAVKKRVGDDIEKTVKSIYQSIGLTKEDGSQGLTIRNGVLDNTWPHMRALILKFAAEEAKRLADEPVHVVDPNADNFI